MDDEYVPEKVQSKGKGKGKRGTTSGELPYYVYGSMAHVIQLDMEDNGFSEEEQPTAKKKRRPHKKAKQGELLLLFLGHGLFTRSGTDSKDVGVVSDDEPNMDEEGLYTSFVV